MNKQRLQETYIGKGQATMTQGRHALNVFAVEYQYRGAIKREVICADWQARARCRRLIAK